MAFLVSDLLQLDIFKGCQLITAQETGKATEITDVGIYDYEYLSPNGDSFFKGDFIISSFLYAKNDVDLFKNGIKALMDDNVACLGIKNVYFDTLPPDIIDYCNKNNFPIFFFDENIFVENIIYQVKRALDYEHYLYNNGQIVDKIINYNGADAVRETMKELHIPSASQYVSVYAGDCENLSANKIFSCFDSKISSKIAFSCYYKNGLIFTFAFRENDDDICINQLHKNLHNLSQELDCIVGVSSTYPGQKNLGYSFKEAYFSSLLSPIMDKKIVFFDESGYYRIFLNLESDPAINRYYNDLIQDMKKNDDEKNSFILETVIKVVENDNNIAKTAEALFQHPNTIRYRINKIHSTFFNGFSEKEFYDQINFLVKFYKLKQVFLG